MAKISGGCLCGAVRFSVESVETHHHVCHCGMCRRWTGGSMLGIAAEGVTFEDETQLGRYRSSAWAERGFCKICGSSLFYRLKPTDGYTMTIGSFDDPTPFKLVREIFIDQKPGGYAFAGGLPAQTEAEVFAAYASSKGE
jgi:hypothetical protein